MKHKHCDCIVAWANGETIQVATIGKEDWTDIEVPTWSLHFEYRVKPSAPKWPETTMTHDQIYTVWEKQKETLQGGDLEAVANAAIAHACETGQLVLPNPDRDMNIAQAVKYAVINAWNVADDDREYSAMSAVNLESIIKEATK